MSKKMIEVSSGSQQLDGDTLAEAIHKLQMLAKEFSEDAEVFYNQSYEYDTTFEVTTQREETDEEYHQRVNAHAIAAERSVRIRREQYEQLKKEFGE